VRACVISVLSRGQFQLEVLAQELDQALLDLLGFGLGAGEPEQVIVGVPDIPEPAVTGIAGLPVGQALPLLAQLPRGGAVPASPCGPYRIVHRGVRTAGGPACPSGIFRDENCPGELIQAVQVDIGQERGRHAALAALLTR
jgi:hypothetical protein